jgi:hypothetical protein
MEMPSLRPKNNKELETWTLVSLCENCPEIGYCKKNSLKTYRFPDGTEYAACSSHHKSVKIQ